jgi:hypothetical protein
MNHIPMHDAMLGSSCVFFEGCHGQQHLEKCSSNEGVPDGW